MDRNFQKSVISNETHLTVAIYDIIISDDLYLNLSKKPIFKK